MFKTRVVEFSLSSHPLTFLETLRVVQNENQYFEIYKTHSSASLGPEIEVPATSRILPGLIVRPCPTLRSAVAHDSESFLGVVH